MSQDVLFVNVLLAYPLSKEFTYSIDHKCKVGTVVQAPFRSKQYAGVITAIIEKPNLSKSKIKKIITVSNHLFLNSKKIKFLNWVSDYNFIERGQVLKMMMPNNNIFFKDFKTNKDNLPEIYSPHKVKLNKDQLKISNQIIKICGKKTYETILIDGVPGSGKTEVYFRVIQEKLKSNNQILILFPEVSLTTEFVKRIIHRFGIMPDIWHSKISVAKKKNTIKRIITGDSKIVVGARSALFLPYKNLDLIIIDEEHDSSFKQAEKGIYHARDMSVVKASIEKIPLLLVSATPSLETTYNVLIKKYSRVTLQNKYQNLPLPNINIINMKMEKLKKDEWISKTLREAIANNLIDNKQSLLFINKRGYAPVIICKSCGHKVECKNCSSYLVEHLREKNLLCHHCGFNLKTFSLKCNECNNEDKKFIDYGVGIEKVFTEASKLFPKAKICIFSSDHVKSQEDMSDKINKIISHKFDIIIGTQLITKGYHFPLLTCVGVVDADMTLKGGDLRASEKTYQLLYQVAGRAGREEANANVFLQTYFPNNETIISLKEMDRDKFYRQEIDYRKFSDLPPIGKMAAIIVSGNKKAEVDQVCIKLSQNIPNILDVEIYGPAPAPLSRLKGHFRQRFLIHDKKSRNMQKIVNKWIGRFPHISGINITIDIDPHSFV